MFDKTRFAVKEIAKATYPLRRPFSCAYNWRETWDSPFIIATAYSSFVGVCNLMAYSLIMKSSDNLYDWVTDVRNLALLPVASFAADAIYTAYNWASEGASSMRDQSLREKAKKNLVIIEEARKLTNDVSPDLEDELLRNAHQVDNDNLGPLPNHSVRE